MASPVGSAIGSLANGVSLFSRLFPDQLKADPPLLITVPKFSLAMTFDQDNGVSRSPSRTMTYSRPSGVKPPTPFSITRGGARSGDGAGCGARSTPDGGTNSAAGTQSAF